MMLSTDEFNAACERLKKALIAKFEPTRVSEEDGRDEGYECGIWHKAAQGETGWIFCVGRNWHGVINWDEINAIVANPKTKMTWPEKPKYNYLLSSLEAA